MLHVLLAGPQRLHRRATRSLGNGGGLGQEVHLQPPAPATAAQRPGRVEAGGRVRQQVSARSVEDVELGHQELLRIAGWHAHGEDVILARERHLLALREALGHVEAAGTQLSALELFAEVLLLAQ